MFFVCTYPYPPIEGLPQLHRDLLNLLELAGPSLLLQSVASDYSRMEFNFTWKHDRPRLCCFASGSALLSERTREESEASARCNKVLIGEEGNAIYFLLLLLPPRGWNATAGTSCSEVTDENRGAEMRENCGTICRTRQKEPLEEGGLGMSVASLLRIAGRTD